MNTRKFYELNIWIGREGQHEKKLWEIGHEWHYKVDDFFNHEKSAKPESLLQRPLKVIARRSDVRQDFAFCIFYPLIVSSRIRTVFEQYAIDDCEFYPVVIEHNNKIIDESYSAMRPIHLINAADPVRSHMLEKTYINFKVDEARVPLQRRAFRVMQTGYNVVVDDVLRMSLGKLKPTGIEFRAV